MRLYIMSKDQLEPLDLLGITETEIAQRLHHGGAVRIVSSDLDLQRRVRLVAQRLGATVTASTRDGITLFPPVAQGRRCRD